MVAEVGRAGSQHHLVSAESLALDIDHDVAQAALHAELVQVAQHGVTEVRDLQLNVPALLHGCPSGRCTALLERGEKIPSLTELLYHLHSEHFSPTSMQFETLGFLEKSLTV